MKLKKYDEEKQKQIIKSWNWYYGKGSRTLEDIEEINKLIESRADDFLKLMALEEYTDFYTIFEGWDPKNSLCNLVYMLQRNQSSKKDALTVDEFLDYVNEAFNSCDFKQDDETIIENALTVFVKISNKKS